MNATGWQLSSILSSLYYLFRDAPVRREDFVTISGSPLVPLKFVSHRWLENVPVCQRVLMLWDNVADYVKATEDGRVNRPKNKSYEVVKECPKDPCFVTKLHFFKCIANQLHPFLAKYQTSKPMLLFLSDHLCMIIRSLMRRFIKSDILKDASDEQLVKIKVADQKIRVNNKRVDVGFAREKVKGIPVFGSERFANFQSAEDRVDTLFFECMANESYKSLFSVVKLILILTHG